MSSTTALCVTVPYTAGATCEGTVCVKSALLHAQQQPRNSCSGRRAAQALPPELAKQHWPECAASRRLNYRVD